MRQFYDPDASLPSAGSSGLVRLLPWYYESTKTAHLPFHLTLFTLIGDTCVYVSIFCAVRLHLLLPSNAARHQPGVICFPLALIAALFNTLELASSPRFLSIPHYTFALLIDPGRKFVPDPFIGFIYCPHYYHDEGFGF